MTPTHPLRPRRGVALVAAAGLGVVALLGACGDDDGDAATTATTEPTDTSAAAPDGEGIEVSGVWARSSPMVTSAGAVYLEVSNTGSEDDALLGASVPASVAAETEVHETRAADDDGMDDDADDGMEDDADDDGMDDGMDDDADDDGSGMMEMVPVDRIVVPAGSTVVLEPGGHHVMLLELVVPLEVGDEIEVTLTFEVAGDVVVTAVVADAAP